MSSLNDGNDIYPQNYENSTRITGKKYTPFTSACEYLTSIILLIT